MITLEMIKELNAMVDTSIIRATLASKAIQYIEQADQDEIDEFDYMSVTEAVDSVLDTVRYI